MRKRVVTALEPVASMTSWANGSLKCQSSHYIFATNTHPSSVSNSRWGSGIQNSTQTSSAQEEIPEKRITALAALGPSFLTFGISSET
jgi:hypothetical protein